jgi:hypothetical protein
MAKNFMKKYSLSAKGILDINDAGIFIEDEDTGVAVDMRDLLDEFDERSIKLSVNYDEEY